MSADQSEQSMPAELTLAIGLIWGHLNARRFQEAHTLARACAGIWPLEKRLGVMLACAAIELRKPLDPAVLDAVREIECGEWREMILRRAQLPS